jgi:hypothetical protein
VDSSHFRKTEINLETLDPSWRKVSCSSFTRRSLLRSLSRHPSFLWRRRMEFRLTWLAMASPSASLMATVLG